MTSAKTSAIHYVLWTLQLLLALLFLFAGVVKLILPVEVMTEQVKFPGLLLRFVAVAEILGAAGLILPGLLRIRTGLTPLAASGLVVIMAGATVVVVSSISVVQAIIPMIVGLFAAFVVYGRRHLASLPERNS